MRAVWETQRENIDVHSIVNTVLQKLLELHRTVQGEDILRMPKLRTYKLLTRHQGPAAYVTHVMSTSNRSALSKLRNGTFPINIETGRYVGLPEELRICEVCDSSCTESETHFVLFCACYSALRSELFRKVENITGASLCGASSDALLNILLNNEHPAVSRAVAKYINDCYELRSVKLRAH